MATIPSVLEIPIGEVVKAWREHHGLSVTAFAQRAGIPKAYVSELEHLKIDTPGTERMGQLAAGLGLDYWDLVQRRMPSMDSEAGGQVATTEAPGARHPGGFAFGSPIKLATQGRRINDGEEERLLHQLSDQVDEVRRTLDALLATKASSHGDHGER